MFKATEEIVKAVLTHPDCSVGLTKDKESLEYAVEHLLEERGYYERDWDASGHVSTLAGHMMGDIGRMRLENRESYIMSTGEKFRAQRIEEFDKFAKDLPEDVEAFYAYWYMGPLAARGFFLAVNKDGIVNKQETLWIS